MITTRIAVAALVATVTGAFAFTVAAQDMPESIAACISNGTKVRHTYLQHTDPEKLKEAVRLFESKAPNADYPEGTVIRMIPGEAMVKRTKSAFPNTNGWEYFALDITAERTGARARGDAAGNRLGTCQSCHVKAAAADYLCGAGDCGSLPLTEEQIARLQANDPRCAK